MLIGGGLKKVRDAIGMQVFQTEHSPYTVVVPPSNVNEIYSFMYLISVYMYTGISVNDIDLVLHVTLFHPPKTSPFTVRFGDTRFQKIDSIVCSS